MLCCVACWAGQHGNSITERRDWLAAPFVPNVPLSPTSPLSYCRADAALRTIDTDTGPRGEMRGTRCLAPGTLELLSYPMPSYLSASPSQQQLGASSSAAAAAEAAQHQRQQRRQQYGVRLRVAGSGWTPAMALDIVDLSAAAGDAAQAQAAQVSLVGLAWRCAEADCPPAARLCHPAYDQRHHTPTTKQQANCTPMRSPCLRRRTTSRMHGRS